MTIVLITHDIDESVYVGDRVVVLSKSPAGIVGDLPVELPGPRDQITTREHPDFVHLRAEVGRLVRGQDRRPGRPRPAHRAARGPGRRGPGLGGPGRDHAPPRARLACRNAVSRSSGQVLITSSVPSQPRCAVPIP